MKNIDIIFNNVQYRNALKSLKEYEKDREEKSY